MHVSKPIELRFVLLCHELFHPDQDQTCSVCCCYARPTKGVKVWGKAIQSCCGGPVVSHHPTDSLTAGWLGGLGPAKESRSVARQAKVQVEGIAYSFCGLWISSVLACLCVTSQLNSTAPGSIPGGLSV